MSINIDQLKQKAKQFRREILEIISRAGSGHPGGSLSMVEILISLYESKLRYKANDPQWDDRDRVVISKGHATPAVYVALANYGFFPKEELKQFRQYKSMLQGHVYRSVPGVEFNTGSLGHGLAVANGMALAGKMNKKEYKVYCILGDGELQEGSIWESAMTASHHKIDNVCAIVDYNKVQQNDLVNKIKNLEPLKQRWESFGWEAVEINGHDFTELKQALDKFGSVKGKPFVIIANTKKGNGISFMELNPAWHGVAPNKEQLQKALAELT